MTNTIIGLVISHLSLVIIFGIFFAVIFQIKFYTNEIFLHFRSIRAIADLLC